MFKDIDINRKYRSDISNIPCDFLIPLLSSACHYKRAVGYFSTTALTKLSVGLVSMAKNNGHIDIICSPQLSKQDIEAINHGYKVKEEVFLSSLEEALRPPIDEFEEERLNLVANLVASGNLNFKIAFLENDNGINIYHEKIAIAYDNEGSRVSFTGSMNDSENGLMDNFESIVVFCDWKSKDQSLYIDETEKDFNRLWDNNTNKVKVIDFPKIVIEKLMTYKKDSIDYEIDKKQFYVESMVKGFINMPCSVKLHDYQIEAIKKWEHNDFIGIYDMATGTGKTFTALASMEHLAKKLNDNIAVFILCPYVHLVNQWEEDLLFWGTSPIVAHSQSSDKKWDTRLLKAFKRFKTIKKPFICITTNDTYTSDKIQQVFSQITESMNVLFVVDEAHNIGASKISTYLRNEVKYRLALSATIERFRDKHGTDIIFDYFKERCIEYTLNKAIEEGKALCNYEYHVIYSFLTDEELSKYNRITNEIKKCIKYENGKVKFSEAAKVKLFERKRVLAGAGDKIYKLRENLEKYKNDKHILVYCGATKIYDEDTESMEKQINVVGRMIEKELNMSVHRFTSNEDAHQRKTIKDCFANGMYQVLTAIKCLDEGVNIPDIRIAFILSSSQNPKEFIQRRGRLLRKSEGKDKAIIYDFVTLPRDFAKIKYGDFEFDKGIVIGEMLRIKEFAELSLNKAEGLNVIDEIQEAYGVCIDLEEELQNMKEMEFDE